MSDSAHSLAAPSTICGARGAVDLVVAEIRRVPGAGFHGDLETELDEFFDDFGHGGNALFTGRRLFWYAYDLRHETPLFITGN